MSVRRWIVRTLLLFLAPLAAPVASAADPEALATRAGAFVKLFFDGEFDAADERMAPGMRAAMDPAKSKALRDGLVAQNGPVREIGEAWHEDDLGGFVRFRVPVTLEKAKLDVRIVFDGSQKVTGMFFVPHAPASPIPAEEESDAPPLPPERIAGHWEGAIEIPGMQLAVLVDLEHEESVWRGTCDIPAQSVKGLPLGGIRVTGNRIVFAIEGIPGGPTFDGRLEEGAIAGTFTQAGQSFPFRLGREELDRPARPQHPKPPFPYGEEDVTYRNGEITLAGTLTLPAGKGPFPAAVLLTGSGPQDRNEEIFDHKPFLVLADHLARAGIAVLRSDDRGVGGSTGNVNDATLEDFARDALAAIRLLASRKEIDAKKIGLIGHSEGGIVGPLAASMSDDVAYVVMLAGTGVSGDRVLVRQLELALRAGGMAEEQLTSVLSEQSKLIELIKEGAEEERIREQFRKLALPTDGSDDADDLFSMQAVASPWYRYFLNHDPRTSLRKVRVPVLALFGELDLQVEPAQNLPPVREALAKAGNPDVTIEELPGLNHLFQEAMTGTPNEYYVIEETINPAVLDRVRDWILARFGPVDRPDRPPS